MKFYNQHSAEEIQHPNSSEGSLTSIEFYQHQQFEKGIASILPLVSNILIGESVSHIESSFVGSTQLKSGPSFI